MPGRPLRSEAEGDGIAPRALPRYALAHELYARALGAVTLLAWLSLHTQLAGLFGPRGIVPLEQRLSLLLERDGAAAFWDTPSLFHLIGGSLPAQHAVVIAGELAAALMTVGVLPGALCVGSFVLYLSFVSVGWPFIPLQWDTLLLEALVLGALLGRWRGGPSTRTLSEPHVLARWVGFSLVSRVMLASGLVKLLSGDPRWRDGTALTFHHWTQSLPSPLAPFLHALPPGLHALETALTLVLEILVPLLVLAGVRGRRIAAAVFVGLMVVFTVSGNYGFFGLLTAALAIPLVDDDVWTRALPSVARVIRLEPGQRRLVAPGVYAVLAALAFATSLGMPLPGLIERALSPFDRLHVAGHYGLFAVMTTDRPELVFEATDDATLEGPWEAYDFWEKPADPTRGPRWCVPHMPCFDWMLWFEALAEPDGTVAPWVRNVVRGLLEDRAEIRALFRRLPLDGHTPRAVRVVRARYRFATSGEAAWTVEERDVIATFRRRDER